MVVSIQRMKCHSSYIQKGSWGSTKAYNTQYTVYFTGNIVSTIHSIGN